MFRKMEMFTGRILSDKTVSDPVEAARLNEVLLINRSTARYVRSTKELGEFEEQYKLADFEKDDVAKAARQSADEKPIEKIFSGMFSSRESVKPPKPPARNFSRRKGVRNFFGAKKALILLSLLFLSGCDLSHSPDADNKERYAEALKNGRVPWPGSIKYDQEAAGALVKAEADISSSPVTVKMRHVKLGDTKCPHCGKSFQIVEE